MAESFQWTGADVAMLPILAMTGTAIGPPTAGCAAAILALGKYPATYPRQGGHAGLQGLTMTSTSFVGAVRPAGGRARRSVHSRQIHHAQA
jgi:hypothetical protein